MSLSAPPVTIEISASQSDVSSQPAVAQYLQDHNKEQEKSAVVSVPTPALDRVRLDLGKWLPFNFEQLSAAQEEHKRVVLDFYADWCGPCKRFANKTLSEEKVKKALASFVLLRVDLSDYNSPEANELRERFDIFNVPTIVFLDEAGHEINGARVEGFLEPEMFLESIQIARTNGLASGTDNRETHPIETAPVRSKVTDGIQSQIDAKTLNDFSLEYGRVQEAFFPARDHNRIAVAINGRESVGEHVKTTAPVVILIQDAHRSFSAQKNINLLVDHFVNNFDVTQIGVEGAAKDYHFGILEKYPNQRVVEQVANKLLAKGLLSGAEYAGLHLGISSRLRGIENSELYSKNVEMFRNFTSSRQKLEQLSEALEQTARSLRDRFYSRELKQLDTLASGFKKGDTEIEDFQHKLIAFARAQKISLESYPNIKQFEGVLKSNRSLDYTALKKERDEAIRWLSSTKDENAKVTLNLLLEKYHQHNVDDLGFYSGLVDLIRQTKMDPPSSIEKLSSYVETLHLAGRLNMAEVTREYTAIESHIARHLAADPVTAEIVQFSEAVSVLNKLAVLELTKDDISLLEEMRSFLTPERVRTLINDSAKKGRLRLSIPKELDYLPRYMADAFSFYYYAEQRDHAMVENLLKSSREVELPPTSPEWKTWLEDRPISLIVVGGYHTGGITSELRDRNIPYLVFTPSISDLNEQIPYDELMMGQFFPDNFLASTGLSATQAPRFFNPMGDSVSLLMPVVSADGRRELQSRIINGRDFETARDLYVLMELLSEHLLSEHSLLQNEKGASVVPRLAQAVQRVVEALESLRNSNQLGRDSVLADVRSVGYRKGQLVVRLRKNSILNRPDVSIPVEMPEHGADGIEALIKLLPDPMNVGAPRARQLMVGGVFHELNLRNAVQAAMMGHEAGNGGAPQEVNHRAVNTSAAAGFGGKSILEAARRLSNQMSRNWNNRSPLGKFAAVTSALGITAVIVAYFAGFYFPVAHGGIQMASISGVLGVGAIESAVAALVVILRKILHGVGEEAEIDTSRLLDAYQNGNYVGVREELRRITSTYLPKKFGETLGQEVFITDRQSVFFRKYLASLHGRQKALLDSADAEQISDEDLLVAYSVWLRYRFTDISLHKIPENDENPTLAKTLLNDVALNKHANQEIRNLAHLLFFAVTGETPSPAWQEIYKDPNLRGLQIDADRRHIMVREDVLGSGFTEIVLGWQEMHRLMNSKGLWEDLHGEPKKLFDRVKGSLEHTSKDRHLEARLVVVYHSRHVVEYQKQSGEHEVMRLPVFYKLETREGEGVIIERNHRQLGQEELLYLEMEYSALLANVERDMTLWDFHADTMYFNTQMSAQRNNMSLHAFPAATKYVVTQEPSLDHICSNEDGCAHLCGAACRSLFSITDLSGKMQTYAVDKACTECNACVNICPQFIGATPLTALGKGEIRSRAQSYQGGQGTMVSGRQAANDLETLERMVAVEKDKGVLWGGDISPKPKPSDAELPRGKAIGAALMEVYRGPSLEQNDAEEPVYDIVQFEFSPLTVEGVHTYKDRPILVTFFRNRKDPKDIWEIRRPLFRAEIVVATDSGKSDIELGIAAQRAGAFLTTSISPFKTYGSDHPAVKRFRDAGIPMPLEELMDRLKKNQVDQLLTPILSHVPAEVVAYMNEKVRGDTAGVLEPDIFQAYSPTTDPLLNRLMFRDLPEILFKTPELLKEKQKIAAMLFEKMRTGRLKLSHLHSEYRKYAKKSGGAGCPNCPEENVQQIPFYMTVFDALLRGEAAEFNYFDPVYKAGKVVGLRCVGCFTEVDHDSWPSHLGGGTTTPDGINHYRGPYGGEFAEAMGIAITLENLVKKRLLKRGRRTVIIGGGDGGAIIGDSEAYTLVRSQVNLIREKHPDVRVLIDINDTKFYSNTKGQQSHVSFIGMATRTSPWGAAILGTQQYQTQAINWKAEFPNFDVGTGHSGNRRWIQQFWFDSALRNRSAMMWNYCPCYDVIGIPSDHSDHNAADWASVGLAQETKFVGRLRMRVHPVNFADRDKDPVVIDAEGNPIYNWTSPPLDIVDHAMRRDPMFREYFVNKDQEKGPLKDDANTRFTIAHLTRYRDALNWWIDFESAVAHKAKFYTDQFFEELKAEWRANRHNLAAFKYHRLFDDDGQIIPEYAYELEQEFLENIVGVDFLRKFEETRSAAEKQYREPQEAFLKLFNQAMNMGRELDRLRDEGKEGTAEYASLREKYENEVLPQLNPAYDAGMKALQNYADVVLSKIKPELEAASPFDTLTQKVTSAPKGFRTKEGARRAFFEGVLDRLLTDRDLAKLKATRDVGNQLRIDRAFYTSGGIASPATRVPDAGEKGVRLRKTIAQMGGFLIAGVSKSGDKFNSIPGIISNFFTDSGAYAEGDLIFTPAKRGQAVQPGVQISHKNIELTSWLYTPNDQLAKLRPLPSFDALREKSELFLRKMDPLGLILANTARNPDGDPDSVRDVLMSKFTPAEREIAVRLMQKPLRTFKELEDLKEYVAQELYHRELEYLERYEEERAIEIIAAAKVHIMTVDFVALAHEVGLPAKVEPNFFMLGALAKAFEYFPPAISETFGLEQALHPDRQKAIHRIVGPQQAKIYIEGIKRIYNRFQLDDFKPGEFPETIRYPFDPNVEIPEEEYKQGPESRIFVDQTGEAIGMAYVQTGSTFKLKSGMQFPITSSSGGMEAKTELQSQGVPWIGRIETNVSHEKTVGEANLGVSVTSGWNTASTDTSSQGLFLVIAEPYAIAVGNRHPLEHFIYGRDATDPTLNVEGATDDFWQFRSRGGYMVVGESEQESVYMAFLAELLTTWMRLPVNVGIPGIFGTHKRKAVHFFDDERIQAVLRYVHENVDLNIGMALNDQGDTWSMGGSTASHSELEHKANKETAHKLRLLVYRYAQEILKDLSEGKVVLTPVEYVNPHPSKKSKTILNMIGVFSPEAKLAVQRLYDAGFDDIGFMRERIINPFPGEEVVGLMREHGVRNVIVFDQAGDPGDNGPLASEIRKAIDRFQNVDDPNIQLGSFRGHQGGRSVSVETFEEKIRLVHLLVDEPTKAELDYQRKMVKEDDFLNKYLLREITAQYMRDIQRHTFTPRQVRDESQTDWEKSEIENRMRKLLGSKNYMEFFMNYGSSAFWDLREMFDSTGLHEDIVKYLEILSARHFLSEVLMRDREHDSLKTEKELGVDRLLRYATVLLEYSQGKEDSKDTQWKNDYALAGEFFQRLLRTSNPEHAAIVWKAQNHLAKNKTYRGRLAKAGYYYVPKAEWAAQGESLQAKNPEFKFITDPEIEKPVVEEYQPPKDDRPEMPWRKNGDPSLLFSKPGMPEPIEYKNDEADRIRRKLFEVAQEVHGNRPDEQRDNPLLREIPRSPWNPEAIEAEALERLAKDPSSQLFGKEIYGVKDRREVESYRITYVEVISETLARAIVPYETMAIELRDTFENYGQLELKRVMRGALRMRAFSDPEWFAKAFKDDAVDEKSRNREFNKRQQGIVVSVEEDMLTYLKDVVYPRMSNNVNRMGRPYYFYFNYYQVAWQREFRQFITDQINALVKETGERLEKQGPFDTRTADGIKQLRERLFSVVDEVSHLTSIEVRKRVGRMTGPIHEPADMSALEKETFVSLDEGIRILLNSASAVHKKGLFEDLQRVIQNDQAPPSQAAEAVRKSAGEWATTGDFEILVAQPLRQVRNRRALDARNRLRNQTAGSVLDHYLLPLPIRKDIGRDRHQNSFLNDIDAALNRSEEEAPELAALESKVRSGEKLTSEEVHRLLDLHVRRKLWGVRPDTTQSVSDYMTSQVGLFARRQVDLKYWVNLFILQEALISGKYRSESDQRKRFDQILKRLNDDPAFNVDHPRDLGIFVRQALKYVNPETGRVFTVSQILQSLKDRVGSSVVRAGELEAVVRLLVWQESLAEQSDLVKKSIAQIQKRRRMDSVKELLLLAREIYRGNNRLGADDIVRTLAGDGYEISSGQPFTADIIPPEDDREFDRKSVRLFVPEISSVVLTGSPEHDLVRSRDSLYLFIEKRANWLLDGAHAFQKEDAVATRDMGKKVVDYSIAWVLSGKTETELSLEPANVKRLLDEIEKIATAGTARTGMLVQLTLAGSSQADYGFFSADDRKEYTKNELLHHLEVLNGLRENKKIEDRFELSYALPIVMAREARHQLVKSRPDVNAQNLAKRLDGWRTGQFINGEKGLALVQMEFDTESVEPAGEYRKLEQFVSSELGLNTYAESLLKLLPANEKENGKKVVTEFVRDVVEFVYLEVLSQNDFIRKSFADEEIRRIHSQIEQLQLQPVNTRSEQQELEQRMHDLEEQTKHELPRIPVNDKKLLERLIRFKIPDYASLSEAVDRSVLEDLPDIIAGRGVFRPEDMRKPKVFTVEELNAIIKFFFVHYLREHNVERFYTEADVMALFDYLEKVLGHFEIAPELGWPVQQTQLVINALDPGSGELTNEIAAKIYAGTAKIDCLACTFDCRGLAKKYAETLLASKRIFSVPMTPILTCHPGKDLFENTARAILNRYLGRVLALGADVSAEELEVTPAILGESHSIAGQFLVDFAESEYTPQSGDPDPERSFLRLVNGDKNLSIREYQAALFYAVNGNGIVGRSSPDVFHEMVSEYVGPQEAEVLSVDEIDFLKSNGVIYLKAAKREMARSFDLKVRWLADTVHAGSYQFLNKAQTMADDAYSKVRYLSELEDGDKLLILRYRREKALNVFAPPVEAAFVHDAHMGAKITDNPQLENAMQAEFLNNVRLPKTRELVERLGDDTQKEATFQDFRGRRINERRKVLIEEGRIGKDVLKVARSIQSLDDLNATIRVAISESEILPDSDLEQHFMDYKIHLREEVLKRLTTVKIDPKARFYWEQLSEDMQTKLTNMKEILDNERTAFKKSPDGRAWSDIAVNLQRGLLQVFVRTEVDKFVEFRKDAVQALVELDQNNGRVTTPFVFDILVELDARKVNPYTTSRDHYRLGGKDFGYPISAGLSILNTGGAAVPTYSITYSTELILDVLTRAIRLNLTNVIRRKLNLRAAVLPASTALLGSVVQDTDVFIPQFDDIFNSLRDRFDISSLAEPEKLAVRRMDIMRFLRNFDWQHMGALPAGEKNLETLQDKTRIFFTRLNEKDRGLFNARLRGEINPAEWARQKKELKRIEQDFTRLVRFVYIDLKKETGAVPDTEAVFSEFFKRYDVGEGSKGEPGLDETAFKKFITRTIANPEAIENERLESIVYGLATRISERMPTLKPAVAKITGSTVQKPITESEDVLAAAGGEYLKLAERVEAELSTYAGTDAEAALWQVHSFNWKSNFIERMVFDSEENVQGVDLLTLLVALRESRTVPKIDDKVRFKQRFAKASSDAFKDRLIQRTQRMINDQFVPVIGVEAARRVLRSLTRNEIENALKQKTVGSIALPVVAGSQGFGVSSPLNIAIANGTTPNLLIKLNVDEWAIRGERKLSLEFENADLEEEYNRTVKPNFIDEQHEQNLFVALRILKRRADRTGLKHVYLYNDMRNAAFFRFERVNGADIPVAHFSIALFQHSQLSNDMVDHVLGHAVLAPIRAASGQVIESRIRDSRISPVFHPLAMDVALLWRTLERMKILRSENGKFFESYANALKESSTIDSSGDFLALVQWYIERNEHSLVDGVAERSVVLKITEYILSHAEDFPDSINGAQRFFKMKDSPDQFDAREELIRGIVTESQANVGRLATERYRLNQNSKVSIETGTQIFSNISESLVRLTGTDAKLTVQEPAQVWNRLRDLYRDRLAEWLKTAGHAEPAEEAKRKEHLFDLRYEKASLIFLSELSVAHAPGHRKFMQYLLENPKEYNKILATYYSNAETQTRALKKLIDRFMSRPLYGSRDALAYSNEQLEAVRRILMIRPDPVEFLFLREFRDNWYQRFNGQDPLPATFTPVDNIGVQARAAVAKGDRRKSFPLKDKMAFTIVVHQIMEVFGYLSEEAIAQVLRTTSLTIQDIEPMVIFFGGVHSDPRGKIRYRVCMGQACATAGGDKVRDFVLTQIGVGGVGDINLGTGQQLETVDCVGACALAPIIVVENEDTGETTFKVKIDVDDNRASKAIADHEIKAKSFVNRVEFFRDMAKTMEPGAPAFFDSRFAADAILHLPKSVKDDLTPGKYGDQELLARLISVDNEGSIYALAPEPKHKPTEEPTETGKHRFSEIIGKLVPYSISFNHQSGEKKFISTFILDENRTVIGVITADKLLEDEITLKLDSALAKPRVVIRNDQVWLEGEAGPVVGANGLNSNTIAVKSSDQQFFTITFPGENSPFLDVPQLLEAGVSTAEDQRFVENQDRLLMKNVGQMSHAWDFDEADGHGAFDGLKAVFGLDANWKQVREPMTPDEIITELKVSGLSGRGGAFFGTGIKWAAAKNEVLQVEAGRNEIGQMAFVVANNDEGDTGAFADRTLVSHDPMSVLSGMIIAAYVNGHIRQGFFYTRDEYRDVNYGVDLAINELRRRGILGKNVFGIAGFDFDMKISPGKQQYLGGEKRGILAATEGYTARIRTNPAYNVEAIRGLFDLPTVLNNVKTLGYVSRILSGEGWVSVDYILTEDTKVRMRGQEWTIRVKPGQRIAVILGGKVPIEIPLTEKWEEVREEVSSKPVAVFLKGGKWFWALGDGVHGGPLTFSMSGKLNRGGVVEVNQNNRTWRDVIFKIGGGPQPGTEIIGANIGGPAGGVVSFSGQSSHVIDQPVGASMVTGQEVIFGSGSTVMQDRKVVQPPQALIQASFIASQACGACPSIFGAHLTSHVVRRITEGSGNFSSFAAFVAAEAFSMHEAECLNCPTVGGAANTVLRRGFSFDHSLHTFLQNPFFDEDQLFAYLSTIGAVTAKTVFVLSSSELSDTEFDKTFSDLVVGGKIQDAAQLLESVEMIRTDYTLTPEKLRMVRNGLQRVDDVVTANNVMLPRFNALLGLRETDEPDRPIRHTTEIVEDRLKATLDRYRAGGGLASAPSGFGTAQSFVENPILPTWASGVLSTAGELVSDFLTRRQIMRNNEIVHPTEFDSSISYLVTSGAISPELASRIVNLDTVFPFIIIRDDELGRAIGSHIYLRPILARYPKLLESVLRGEINHLEAHARHTNVALRSQVGISSAAVPLQEEFPSNQFLTVSNDAWGGSYRSDVERLMTSGRPATVVIDADLLERSAPLRAQMQAFHLTRTQYGNVANTKHLIVDHGNSENSPEKAASVVDHNMERRVYLVDSNHGKLADVPAHFSILGVDVQQLNQTPRYDVVMKAFQIADDVTSASLRLALDPLWAYDHTLERFTLSGKLSNPWKSSSRLRARLSESERAAGRAIDSYAWGGETAKADIQHALLSSRQSVALIISSRLLEETHLRTQIETLQAKLSKSGNQAVRLIVAEPSIGFRMAAQAQIPKSHTVALLHTSEVKSGTLDHRTYSLLAFDPELLKEFFFYDVVTKGLLLAESGEHPSSENLGPLFSQDQGTGTYGFWNVTPAMQDLLNRYAEAVAAQSATQVAA